MIISSVMVAFNLNLYPLFDAIAEIESDYGRLSKNVYQLQDAYIDDVNRILGRNEFDYNDKYDVGKSKEMMVIYLMRYGAIYESKTGNAVSYSVLARIHNGGPNGWRKPSTLKYWHKVKAAMDAAERKTQK